MKKGLLFIIILMNMMTFGYAQSILSQSSSGTGIRLNVLNYFDIDNTYGVADQDFIWGEFEKRNPDVTIVREDNYNEPFHSQTEMYAVYGNLPDVLFVWPGGRSITLHQKKLLKDLAPLIDKDGLRNTYVPQALNMSKQVSNYQSMIPMTVTASHAFYVNLEVLRDCGLQPAKTYAELKAQVPVLRAKGYETVLMPNESTWVMQSCLLSMIAGRFCGPDWHDKILKGQSKFTNRDFIAALNFIRQMYTDGVLAISSLDMDYVDGPGLFAANKGAYYIDGDWRFADFITNGNTRGALISPARQNNFLVTVFPDIENAKINKSTSIIAGGGWAMSAAIPAGSQKEDAAWRLIKWLTGVEVQTLNVESREVSNPVNRGVDINKLNLEPIQKAAANLGNQYTTGTIIIDAIFEAGIYEPINDGLRAIALGTKTPQQVAVEVQSSFDSGRKAGYW